MMGDMSGGNSSASSFWGSRHTSWSPAHQSSPHAGAGAGAGAATPGNNADPKMAEKLMTELQVSQYKVRSTFEYDGNICDVVFISNLEFNPKLNNLDQIYLQTENVSKFSLNSWSMGCIELWLLASLCCNYLTQYLPHLFYRISDFIVANYSRQECVVSKHKFTKLITSLRKVTSLTISTQIAGPQFTN